MPGRVPPPLPGRAARNCVGQHQILLKGCNAKHGFYIFSYVYSYSARRNQTQIKKEEADNQSIIPSHRLEEDNTRRGPTEDGAAPEQHGSGSADVTDNGIGFKPENYSAPGIGRDAQSPRPGSGARGERPSEAVAGNRSSVRREDRDDGAPRRVPAEGVLTAGRDSTPATGRAGDEGSGDTTIPGQGQEGIMQGTGMGGATLASITENMEDVEVDAKGVDEYAYIPDSGSVTITRGRTGNTMRDTSFTQISPDKDDEVHIFIERANIHVGEQETTQAGATVGSQDDSILTVGTISPMPRLGITVTHGSLKDQQPEPPSHKESTTSSPRDGHPTGDNEDGATTIDDGEGPATPSPWKVAGGDVTVPAEIGIGGNNDGEARSEGQKFKGRPGHLAVTTPLQERDKKATATVPAQQASILMATTMVTPG
ncbi:PREDICTED: matrix extracellular phosphoglycoprotein, partial [Apaloderma vittatum]|uniref:matrix extracellular phosphoglycoprotein n=1 Tax=Apaloderma vittatum TaxID=57397 RepID=UPI000521C006